MSKAVLLGLCDVLGVEGVNASSTKAAIIAAILSYYESADATTVYTEEELTAMTKPVLLGLCEELEITGVNNSSNKAAIIAAILAYYDNTVVDTYDSNTVYTEEELTAMTTATLRALVIDLEITGITEETSKADIITAILTYYESLNGGN